MNQLASIYVILQSHQDVLSTKQSGSLLRKVYLDSLQQVHPIFYSAMMQAHHGPKPFTVSHLHRLKVDNPHDHYRLRLTTLQPQLTAITINSVLPQWMTYGMCMNEAVLSVHDVQIDEQVNAWTGTTTWEDLILSAPMQKQITLQFVSPTAFKKTGNRWIVLPEPARIFGSLLQRWNTFSPMLLPDDLLNDIEEIIEITSYDLRTRSIHIENQRPVKGFIGGVTFHIHSDNELLIQYLNALAAFAKFSGVGTRTAVGLGQARQI